MSLIDVGAAAGATAGWAALNSSASQGGVLNNVTEKAIIQVLDQVLASKAFATVFKGVVIANNAASVYHNNRGKYAINTDINAQALYKVVSRGNINGTPVLANQLDNMQKALAEPNLAGIPISSSRISTGREIEVSESMVIVQSAAEKRYWTDNAVPRLKTWDITGYLTPTSAFDDGFVIKPSLTWQVFYLDTCAKSRRPILFKTNRGEFVQVQITSLNTTEDASYNNAIEVSISLKEYNPYFINNDTGAIKTATREVGV